MSTIHGISTDGTNNYRLQETNASHVDIGIGTDLETYVASQKNNLLTQYDNALYSVGRGSQAVVDALDNGDILMALTTEESADFRAGMNNMSELTQVCRNLLDIWSNDGVGSTSTSWDVLKAELQGWVQSQGYATLTGNNTFTGNMIFSKAGQTNLIIRNTNYDNANATGTGYLLRLSGSTDSNVISQIYSGIDNNGNKYISITVQDPSNAANNILCGAFGITSINDTYYGAFYVPDVPRYTGTLVPTWNSINNTANQLVHKTGDEIINGDKIFNGNLYSHRYLYTRAIGYKEGVTPSATVGTGIIFADEDKHNTGYIQAIRYTNGAHGLEFFIDNEAGDSLSSFKYRIDYPSGTVRKRFTVDGNAEVGSIYTVDSQNPGSCGTSTNLWSEVYASNGTIQTSDKALKTEISDIPDAVIRAWNKVNFKQFKMKDAVAKKDSAARIHMGVIANEDADSVMQAFASEGLNARDYGLFCYDEWEDQYEDQQVLVTPERKESVKVVDSQAIYKTVVDANGNRTEVEVVPEKFHMEERVVEEAVYNTEKVLVQPAGHRYSVRYEECLALTCACLKKRIEQLEAMLNK